MVDPVLPLGVLILPPDNIIRERVDKSTLCPVCYHPRNQPPYFWQLPLPQPGPKVQGKVSVPHAVTHDDMTKLVVGLLLREHSRENRALAPVAKHGCPGGSVVVPSPVPPDAVQ